VQHDDRDDRPDRPDRDDRDAGAPDQQPRVVEGAFRWPDAVRVVAAIALAVFAWWVAGLPPFSGGATVAVIFAGATAMAVGAWQRRRTQPSDAPGAADVAGIVGTPGTSSTAGTTMWAVLAAVAGAWQLMAYLQHPRPDHPTVSSLTNGLLDSHLARAAALVLWIIAARGLARR
jgi:hypothetical protein